MSKIFAFHFPKTTEEWLHTMAVVAIVAGAGSVADGDHWRVTLKLMVGAVAVWLKSYPLPNATPEAQPNPPVKP